MTIIFRDYETRSPIPISWGLDNYFSRAEPLILTYAIGDAPVQLIDYTQSPHGSKNALTKVPGSFYDPAAILVAHNNSFDRRVEERLLGFRAPLERQRCTQAQAYSHGLPGSLETLGEVLGIQQKKLTGEDGHKLMLFFCVPRTILKDGTPLWNEPAAHPEKWEAFKRYAIRDVEALREIHKKLPSHNYQGDNLRTWHLDQRINERGFGFDRELALAAQKVLESAKVQQKRYVKALTDGQVTSVTQREKLLDWFNNSGLEIASMKASEIRDALDSDDLNPAHRFLLELRLEGSKSSGAKYRRGLECVGPDGRLRDTMLFSGANRTGRWSGRTLQPQNLSRYSPHWEELNKDAPHEPIEQIALPAILAGDIATLEAHGGVNSVCNDALRSCIIAAPGNEFVAADWSNIEGRVLAWLADDPVQLAYFYAQDAGEAPDSYKYLWAQLFHIPVEQVTKAQRQAAKQLRLACNYLGGTGALVTMALGNNINLDELMLGVLDQVPDAVRRKARAAWRRAFLGGEDYGLSPVTYQSCDALVRLFREANEAVTEAGYGLGRIVMDAVRQPNTLFRALKCDIWYTGSAVIIQLPCGRRLFYWSPQIREEIEQDPETGELRSKEVFWYRASRGKQWRWLRGWAGLYVENITQAVANSVLRAGLLNVDAYAPGSIVLHVHDEVVCETPVGMLATDRLEWLLTDDLLAKHGWMRGLPLAAHAWTGRRYRK